jgi:phosphoacetylglucosamine mutase
MDSTTSARIVSTLSSVTVDGALAYGTAGFRAHSDRLSGALLRVGVLAALRSAALGGRAVGVMVTASHNPAEDNGAKIVDPSGAMLAQEWEARAAAFVNAQDPVAALGALGELVNGPPMKTGRASVVVGADTRPTSKKLVDMVKAGALAVNPAGGSVLDLGVVTTPQLHFVVRAKDRGEPNDVSDYYAILMREYRDMLPAQTIETPICVDCANGVGSFAMAQLVNTIPGMTLINRAGDGDLNSYCGADYVQKKRVMPTVHGKQGDRHVVGDQPPPLWASLDGDADRLVLYAPPSGGVQSLILADGDRFAALAAMFTSKHLMNAGLSDVVIGVAQTAYSNGAATEYLEALRGVKVIIAKTGVKHLEKAVHPFDIGIYWEPNGHGTVLYADAFVDRLQHIVHATAQGDAVHTSAKILLSVGRLANQAVGDGVADLLLVLAILKNEGMSFTEWLNIYVERCSENMVVHVQDKNVICTEDCDRQVTKPAKLRAAVEMFSNGTGKRAFVRPSGTEDVVRVYAEAPPGCESEAKEMVLAIARAVYDTCNGVGERM